MVQLQRFNTTVEILLNICADIGADNVGIFLRLAAYGRHTSIVEILLQRRTDVAVEHVCWARNFAVYGGHASSVNILLQNRTDISVKDVCGALRKATKGGHEAIVTRHVELALESAIQAENAPIIDILRGHQLNMNR